MMKPLKCSAKSFIIGLGGFIALRCRHNLMTAYTPSLIGSPRHVHDFTINCSMYTNLAPAAGSSWTTIPRGN